MGGKFFPTVSSALSALTSPAGRGSLLFLAGLSLTVHEAFLRGPERPSLYILFAGMMGLPAFLPKKKDGA